jgi:hypothetical protein
MFDIRRSDEEVARRRKEVWPEPENLIDITTELTPSPSPSPALRPLVYVKSMREPPKDRRSILGEKNRKIRIEMSRRPTERDLPIRLRTISD